MNCRAKFGAASFILGGEIRNRTNTHMHTYNYKTSTISEGDWRLSTHADLTPRADSSDFGLLGEQSSPKWEIPCPGRLWTTVQNLTPLDLSSPEKSVTVQTHKQTRKKNSKRYIHTLVIGIVWIIITRTQTREDMMSSGALVLGSGPLVLRTRPYQTLITKTDHQFNT